MIVLLAAKSLVVAGGTLLVLRLVRGRSASDRSLVAHLGLGALAALQLGPMVFPPLTVTSSYAFVFSDTAPLGSGAHALAEPNWIFIAYAVPALFLVARTLLALWHLVLLTTRATVVADLHWLQSLAQASQRTGFKKRTALLASREIASPISWGVLQPKILLNEDAIAARGDTDAIVAHELAHVARGDWVKLALARMSVALFWFNPLVWLLAREAHQLREEAADDAVLASEVEDTDYANLLISTARVQSHPLLLGAHGVAPARNSLTRRVKRVLDRGLNRSASDPRWVAAMVFGMAALTVPLITLQFANTALASSVTASGLSDDDSEAIVFPLRRPVAKPVAVAGLTH